MVETRSRTSRAAGSSTTTRARASAAGGGSTSTTTAAETRSGAATSSGAGRATSSGAGIAGGGGAGSGSGSGAGRGGAGSSSSSHAKRASGSSTSGVGAASKSSAGNAAGAGSQRRVTTHYASSTTTPGTGTSAASRYSARSSTATSTRQPALAGIAGNSAQLASSSNPRAASSRSSATAHPQQQQHHPHLHQPYHPPSAQPRETRESQSARLSHSQATPGANAAAASFHHSYNTRTNNNNAVHTVNELIAGKIQQVYVLEDDEEEEDRPPSASASLAAGLHQGRNGSANYPYPQQPSSASGMYPPGPQYAPPSSRAPVGDSLLYLQAARGQAGAAAYRPSPRLNGSVLRGGSTASGRGSAIPGSQVTSMQIPPSAAGSSKGKRKARDEGPYYPSANAGSSSTAANYPHSHLLSMQGQQHVRGGHGNAGSPALSATSSNRWSQSVGINAPAPHGALDRAMQAQHRAAAAAAAAATTAADGYPGDVERGPELSGPVAAASKRRRRDADGNYATSSAGGAGNLSYSAANNSGAYGGGGGLGSSKLGHQQSDYSIISSRHAAAAAAPALSSATGAGYYASPTGAGAGSGAAYVPVASSSSGVAAPASYRGGYPAGQGYLESQYAEVSGSGAGHAPAAAAEELPCDDKEGHYIVRPGEYVGPRYRIINLLGQGTFGKVVECVDVRSRRHVAVKVIRAIQKYRDASQIEIRVLKTLKDHDPLNEHQCIHLIEHFTYRNHVCIVSELLGKSVFDFLKENDFSPFPSMHIWSFAKQLLKSVSFLHRLGLIHTDLKPENILLVSSDHTVVRTTAALSGSSSSRRQPKLRNMLRSTEIRLIDFGSATFDHEYHSAVVSTRHYRAPEIILGMGWSFPCDAWSVGCILVEFLTGDALFQTHDNLEHLAMMEAVLGVMPDDYRRQAEAHKPELFRHGRLNFPNPDVPKQSKRYVRQMKKLQDIISSGTGASNATYAKHNTRFANLVRRLLEFDPQRRITVADALNHPYFDLVEHEFPP